MTESPEGNAPEASERKFKVVYTIIDRGNDKKPVWLRIGAAFVNRDQSINVKLDAHPTNGTLHIRDYVPAEEYRSRRNEEASSTMRLAEPRRDSESGGFTARRESRGPEMGRPSGEGRAAGRRTQPGGV